MRLIHAVFDALKTFDRPATRAELERESGLDKDEVHKGLAGLDRRGILIVDGEPRQLSTYALRPGAERPTDLRGRARWRRPYTPTSQGSPAGVRLNAP